MRKSYIPGYENDEKVCDCRPLICFSSDETESWSEAVDICNYPSATYLVVNNDRLVQLESGGLIVPAAHHHVTSGGRMALRAEGVFFLSDDGAVTWRESKERCYAPQQLASGLREPGVVELKNRSIMARWRTPGKCQYKAFSYDGGESWTTPLPAPEFIGSESPLSIKRNPETGILYAVWPAESYSAERSQKLVKALGEADYNWWK